jgi:hypothetical protein
MLMVELFIKTAGVAVYVLLELEDPPPPPPQPLNKSRVQHKKNFDKLVRISTRIDQPPSF